MTARYRYQYISADPGAGKTEWAIRKARKMLPFNPVLFVVPTRTLCDEIAARSGFVESLHGGHYPTQRIADVITEAIRSCARERRNRALAITDAAYSHLHTRWDNWVVIKDEPDEPLTIHRLVCEDSWRFIQEQVFEFAIHENDSFYRLRVRRPLTWAMTTELDGVFGPLYELQEYLAEPAHYEVLVDRDTWDATHVLRYSVFQLPECWAGWGEVYFMGANFEDSLIYRQWQHQGVEWQRHEPRLGVMPTDRLSIHYLFDDMAWSRQSRDRVSRSPSGRSQTNLAWYLDWIRESLPDGRYVWVANNSLGDQEIGLAGERMPAECHGLNRWRDHTQCVLLGSYLQFTGDELFYQYYRTSTADIRGMRNSQYYVQQLTRTNIRCYDSDLPVTAWVPTRREALDILKYFRGAQVVSPLGDRWRLRPGWQPREILPDDLPPVEGLTMGLGAATREIWLFGPDQQVIDTPLTDDDTASSGTARPFQQKNAALYNIIQRKTAEKIPQAGSIRGRPATKWQGSPLIRMIIEWGQDHVLADWSGGRDQFKRSLPWFCPGIFRTGSRLTRANCLGVSILGLDFDHARFTNQQVSEILRGTEHLIYTTVSHDASRPYRKLRVVVPLSRSITISEHERLMAYYMEAFARLGLGDVDPTTVNAERKFFCPHFESTLHWDRNRKHPLAVDRLLLKIPRVPLVQAPRPEDLVRVEEIERWPQQEQEGIHRRMADIIASMRPHDRSRKACQVGGLLSKIPQDQHAEWFQRLEQAGVDAAAMRSARQYAQR